MSATITWFGHATIRLTLPDGRVIFIDPWIAENPACPDSIKEVPRCDMIVLTHGHFDHVADVGALIKQHDPPVVGNFDLCAALQKRITKGRFQGMNTGGTQAIDGVRISLTKAFHSSGLDAPDGPAYAGMPNGVVIAASGVATVYHAGDTDVFGDMTLIAKLFEPKIAILPIGDLFTMGAKGAALAAEMLQPKAIIPVHYKTFPVLAQSAEPFRDALPANLKDRLVAPDPGVPLPWTTTGLG
jgi:L-ascorbate metabolism protein UlaG (beta-lactamase superfamily)